MRAAVVVVAVVLVVGLTGAIVTLADSGAAGDFARTQERLGAVNPSQLATLIAENSRPQAGSGGTPARTATCVSHGRGLLQNPWSCTVRSPSRGNAARKTVRYRVIVSSSGSITAVTAGGGVPIGACCVETGVGS